MNNEKIKKLIKIGLCIYVICGTLIFPLGMIEIAPIFFISLPLVSIAVGTIYANETISSFKKTIKPGNIPLELKINASNKSNEDFEMQKIYTVDSEKLGFSNPVKKTNDVSFLEENIKTCDEVQSGPKLVKKYHL